MKKVDLLTRNGDFVTSVSVPDFKFKDGIVIKWGCRIFIYNLEDDSFYEGCLVYPMEN